MFHTSSTGTSPASISRSTVSTAAMRAVGVGRARVDDVQRAGRRRRPLRASSGTPRRVGAAGGARSRRCRRAARSRRRAGAAGASVGSSVENSWFSTSTPACGEPVEQRRLARVRVADERDRREVAPAPRPCVASRASRRGRSRSRSSLWMRRSRRRRSTSSCVSPGPRVPMPAPCWLSCVPAAAQARQPVAQLRELDLHHALLARRVLGEDVEDQRDAVDDVDREQLLEVALLRGRELVVEDHDVDVERLARARAARRPCPCRCRSRGRACARRCSTASTGSAPAVSASSASSSSDASASSTSRVPMPVPTSSARWRTTLEVDLGRGEPAALPSGLGARRAHAVGCASDSRSRSRGITTSNTCTTGPPRRTVSPSTTASVAAGHVDAHAVADEAAPVRDRGRRARAGAARLRLARAPFPHPHREPVGAGDGDELDVGAAAGSAASCSMRGPCVGDAARLRDRRRTARSAGCRCRPRRRRTSVPCDVGVEIERRRRRATGICAGSNVTGPMSTSAATTSPSRVALERRRAGGRRRCRR